VELGGEWKERRTCLREGTLRLRQEDIRWNKTPSIGARVMLASYLSRYMDIHIQHQIPENLEAIKRRRKASDADI
jgi:hypothetical protein